MSVLHRTLLLPLQGVVHMIIITMDIITVVMVLATTFLPVANLNTPATVAVANLVSTAVASV